MTIKLSRPEIEINNFDLIHLERQISTKLPEAFKNLYLIHNGGVPERDWWDSEDDFEPIRVKRFKAVAKKDASDALETKYIGGCYLAMTARQVIPATILPFAIDDGGNFFCLDLIDGCVCFFAADIYDADLTASENHLKSYRWLAASFEAFLSGLKDEDDMDF